jgi:hypothetical protein
VFREDECRVRSGNAALNLNILRKMALYRLRNMKMEKKRVSAKRRMMHTFSPLLLYFPLVFVSTR